MRSSCRTKHKAARIALRASTLFVQKLVVFTVFSVPLW